MTQGYFDRWFQRYSRRRRKLEIKRGIADETIFRWTEVEAGGEKVEKTSPKGVKGERERGRETRSKETAKRKRVSGWDFRWDAISTYFHGSDFFQGQGYRYQRFSRPAAITLKVSLRGARIEREDWDKERKSRSGARGQDRGRMEEDLAARVRGEGEKGRDVGRRSGGVHLGKGERGERGGERIRNSRDAC